jgi:ABC-2 type transport system permease protein
MVTIGWLLGAPIEASAIPMALLVLFLGILACNALGTFAASFIVLFKRGEPVVQLFGLAAAVLGGALFPISVLPEWVRWLSYLMPHSYVISAERQLLIPGAPADGLDTGWSIGILAALCVVMFTTGLYVFDRSLRLARRLGILSI